MLKSVVAIVFFAIASFGFLAIYKFIGLWALLSVVGLLFLGHVLYRLKYGHWLHDSDWANRD